MKNLQKHTLIDHLNAVKSGSRVFENVFQSVTRMILEGKSTMSSSTVSPPLISRCFDREETRHRHFDEINSFVSYVKDAAESGSSAEMAFVLVGEPGNGKTFLSNTVFKVPAVLVEG